MPADSMHPGTTLTLIAATLMTLALSAMGSSPAAAQEEGPWLFRVYGLVISPAGDKVMNDVDAGNAGFTVSDGTGFGLDIEYRPSPRFGLEATAIVGDIEAEFTLTTPTAVLTDRKDIGTEILSLGANYHFTHSERLDAHIGILAAMATFDGVTFLTENGLREKRPFDDDVGFGTKLGLDVKLAQESHWFFNAQVCYLLLIMEAETDSGGRDLNLDPLIASIGLGYRR